MQEIRFIVHLFGQRSLRDTVWKWIFYQIFNNTNNILTILEIELTYCIQSTMELWKMAEAAISNTLNAFYEYISLANWEIRLFAKSPGLENYLPYPVNIVLRIIAKSLETVRLTVICLNQPHIFYAYCKKYR